ncbi:hypothetical protein CRG98_045030 [Punica granatum]|uniref:Uncharacterized protein n=1 Tax=Punica granatum TaxID=22663 RepID=A0A2I0HS88_PUNGR|nr:hypothetical protein CRG98_045030 [Punica granatum]
MGISWRAKPWIHLKDAKNTERLTSRPRLEIDNWRCPRNPRMGLSQCFPSVLMCSETTVISVCQKRVSKALGVVGSGWYRTRISTFPRMSYKRKIPCERGTFATGMVLKKPKWIAQCDQGLSPKPLRSGPTREIMMSSEIQSETYSMVLVTLGCVQAYFRVLFICLWRGRLGSPNKKVSMNIRGVHWLRQKISEMRSETTLVILSMPPCLHVCLRWPNRDTRAFVGHSPIMLMRPWSESLLAFSVGFGGPKWGADTRDS